MCSQGTKTASFEETSAPFSEAERHKPASGGAERNSFILPGPEFFISRFEFCTGSWCDVQERASRCSQGKNAASSEETTTSLSETEWHKAVLRGTERDGFILTRPEFQLPVIAGILRSALQNEKEINVLDFGGSFGSVYFQFKSFLPSGTNISWNVVELPEIVERGRKHFETDELHFYHSIDECVENTKPKTILFSGVLHYLEEPYTILGKCAEIGASTLIIDRTPCSGSAEDRLAIHIMTGPERHSEYPLWVLSEPSLIEELSKHWRFLESFGSAVDEKMIIQDIPINFRGFLFDKG
jgi:putative methyltransferase (TIGR04325 family)